MGLLTETLFLDKAGQVLTGIVREGNMEQRNDDMLKTACDIADMRKTAERINGILFAEFFDMQSARDVICEVNLKHPENVRLYNVRLYNLIERTFKSEPPRFGHEGSLFCFALVFNGFQLLRIRKMSRYTLRIL